MFEFQNYMLYKKARELCTKVNKLIAKQEDKTSFDDLKNTAYNVLMFISQSSAMREQKHKLDLLNQGKGSIFETVAILDCLKHWSHINEETYNFFIKELNEMNRILFNVSKKLQSKEHPKAA